MTNTMTAFAATVVCSKFIASATAEDKNPATHEVEIRKFMFVPNRLQVRPGDTISWTNRDVAPHTAIAINKSWDTGAIRKGQSKSMLVTKEMSAAYYCRFHPVMKARLELIVEN